MRLVHVPTYSVTTTTAGNEDDEIVAIPRYSDEMPAYRSDGTRLPPNPPDPASNKACLEPYRHASMDIFRLIRDWCSQLNEGIQLEKGGLDEAFLDITEEVEQQLIDQFDQKYTMIRDELDGIEGDETDIIAENLKLYDTTWMDRLDYTGLGETAIKDAKETDNFETDTETINPEDLIEKVRMKLGKLRIWKGAHLAASLRSRLRSDLNYIASIGISSNKMLAKLVSALYKPDQQTRLDPVNVREFMTRVPFEKIRMMGGKMGKSVLNDTEKDVEEEEEGGEDHEDYESSINHVETAPVMASDLWNLSISQLSDRVGDRQTAAWIYQLIRGHDSSPVTPRSLTKSFMSAKSFRPAVRDWPELHDWSVVLVGELWSRIIEEKENSGRWPSNIVIHFKSFSKISRGSANTWNNTGSTTKSCEFPYSSSIPSRATRSDFLAAVFKLFTAASNDSAVALFPMSRLAVSVTNFKGLEADGKAKATRVDQFFKKHNGDEEVTISPGLDRFFQEKTQTPSEKVQVQAQVTKKPTVSVLEMLKASASKSKNTKIEIIEISEDTETKISIVKRKKLSDSNDGILKYFSKSTDSSPSDSIFTCTEKNCKFKCPRANTKEIQEHSDHHLAMKLASER